MRSRNLRPAPAWITPDLVGRILALAMPVGGQPVPVKQVPTRGVKPTLAIVESKMSNPPATHSRQAEEDEAAIVAPHAASPLRRKVPVPAWTRDEDERLSKAYAAGERIDLVAEELGRTVKAAYSRGKKLGLAHPRDIKGGFVTKPKWSEAENQLLRELYGEIPTRELPDHIAGRSLRSIYQRAFDLDLKHGYQRQWTRAEIRALRIGHVRGLAVADVAAALGRKAFSVSKYASNHRLAFGRRPLLAAPITLEDILNLEDSAAPLPEVKDCAAAARCARVIRAGQRAREVDQRRVERAAKRAREVEQLRLERAAKRAREVEQLRVERAAKRAMDDAERAIERADRRAAAAPVKPIVIREVKPAAICRPARPAPSREPAPRSPARAQPYDSVHRAAAIRRSIERKAAAFVDGDESSKTTGGRLNQAVRGAVNMIIERRAAEDRLGDPVEQAKTLLRRRNYAPVCSMAVYDGDPHLFKVGHRSNLTRDELLAMAARVAA